MSISLSLCRDTIKLSCRTADTAVVGSPRDPYCGDVAGGKEVCRLVQRQYGTGVPLLYREDVNPSLTPQPLTQQSSSVG